MKKQTLPDDETKLDSPASDNLGKKNTLEDLVKEIANPDDILTDKQKTFLEQYVRTGGNISRALKDADYSQGSFAIAKKLLSRPECIAYIENIKQKGFSEAVLTVSEIVNMARRVYNEAMTDAAYKEAMDSVRFLGQYKGMLIDRKQSSTTVETLVSGDGIKDVQMDNERFEQILQKMATKVNPITKN